MKKSMIAAAAALTLSSMVSADALALITQDADEKTPPPPTETLENKGQLAICG